MVIGVFRVCTSSIFFDVTVTDCLIEDGIGIVADFLITKRNLKRKSKLVQINDDGKGRVNHFQKLLRTKVMQKLGIKEKKFLHSSEQSKCPPLSSMNGISV